MATEAAHSAWWRSFEVVFGVPVLAALALQWRLPLSLPRGNLAPILVLGGAPLVALGAPLVVRARRELARYDQPTDPGHPTSRLVTTGVFAISRDPLYLGGAGILAGIALMLNLPWVLVLLPLSLVACRYLLIAPEERYLAARFGADYRRYAASVPRWLGRRAG
jgi:protein-S-isoprenylcysteine O-methyltransferase Ste14